MSPQEGENGEQESKLDITEMAKRWRKNAPSEPSDTNNHLTKSGTSNGTDGRLIDAEGLVVSYQGRGKIYLPKGLQERLGCDGLESRTRIPADFDEDSNDLTIHFGALVGDSA